MASDGIGKELALRNGLKKNCNVCRLGYNMTATVNRMIINGHPYKEIHRMLCEFYEDGAIAHAVSYTSITNHAKKHLGTKDAAVRKIIEKRAVERGMDIEAGVEDLLTDFAVAETMMYKGHQELVSGRMEITAKDLLAATKLVNEFTKDAQGSLDVAQAMAEMSIIMKAVKDVVPQHYFALITERIAQLQAGEDVEDAIIEDEQEEYVLSNYDELE